MARHKRSYTGERLSAFIGFFLTPTASQELKRAAERNGAPTLSELVREIVYRWLEMPCMAASRRRDPETKEIIRALDHAAYENKANGNNLNQLLKQINTTGQLTELREELRHAIAQFNRIADLHIAALEKLLMP